MHCRFKAVPHTLICRHACITQVVQQLQGEGSEVGELCAGRVRWDDPFGGTCQDTFCVSDDGQQLTQVTEMVMNTGRLCNYR